MGLVPTTIIPPRGAQMLVDRLSLTSFTSAISDSRVTTICAPAGSGKTTAALLWFNQLTESGRPGLWLAARAGIHDLPSFLTALKAAGVTAGLPWEHLSPESDPAEWRATLAVQHLPKPILVVDDAQLLPSDALDFLGQAVASARDALTTVIVSRAAIDIPVARTRALGFLVEIGAPELSFTRAEATELVTRIVGGPVDAEAMRHMLHDTQGWASGLVIAANIYRREMNRGIGWKPLVETLHAELAYYFHEEVLSLQSNIVRNFLVDTSVLKELTPSACAAITRSEDARILLDDVFHAGLFLNPIDQERSCYAYHPLFRHSVIGRLQDRAPTRAAELHRRASRYYASAGDPLKALDHAQASGDQEFLADQLDMMANELTYAGYLYRVDELGSELPWAIIVTRPMLLLALAWRRIRRLSFAAAERCINAAAVVAEGRSEDLELSCQLRHRRIMLEAARDNMTAVEHQAEALLFEFGDEYPYLSCTLLAQLMSARRELYHFHDILKLEAETRRALGRPGSEFASIALKSTVAPTLVEHGKTPFARRFLEESLATAEAREGSGSGLAALPALPLAEILYDSGELERAGDLVDRYLPTVRQWGFVDQIASGYLVQARLAFARGDTAQALSGLEEAHLVAIECGLDRLRAFVVAEQVRILVKTGQVAEAEAALRAGDIPVDDEPVPTLTPSRRNESIAIAWLRIEMQRHRLARACKVATRWLECVRRSGAVRSAVLFELLLAEISVLQGNRSKARRAVRAAVELAEPSGWTRIFLDEGEVICSLLTEAYSGGPMLETAADQFATRLVGLMKGGTLVETDEDEDEDENSGLTSRLASREIEILTMVSGGLRNREIGERLGLTEGTVKWYMQQIYDKLGVRRRPQAVMRARQFGLLG